MEKKLKGSFWVAGLAFMLVIVIACQPVYGAAASGLKKDRGVRWLTGNICFYITFLYMQGDIDKGDRDTMRMTYIDRFNIAKELAGVKYLKYSSSYEEDGIDVLENGNYATYCPVDVAFSNELCMKLFHKPLQTPDEQNSFVRAKFLNGYTYVGFGEFGDSYPSYSIKSITKVKKGVYKVKAENRFYNIDPEDGKKYDRIGYTWVTLKKDKKAEYGYRVVKCSYRMFPEKQR